MNKRTTPAKRTPTSATRTSSGTQRVYVDLPTELVRKFNVLAAMRSQPKRALLAQIVEEAVTSAKIA